MIFQSAADKSNCARIKILLKNYCIFYFLKHIIQTFESYKQHINEYNEL